MRLSDLPLLKPMKLLLCQGLLHVEEHGCKELCTLL